MVRIVQRFGPRFSDVAELTPLASAGGRRVRSARGSTGTSPGGSSNDPLPTPPARPTVRSTSRRPRGDGTLSAWMSATLSR